MNCFLSRLFGTNNKRRAQTTCLNLELLEDRLVQSTFNYLSLTASPSLSTVTTTEATYSPSITAVDISANDLAPIQLVQPMQEDANALAPVEGFQGPMESANPALDYPADDGGIHTQALTNAQRFTKGSLAIEERLREAGSDVKFGDAWGDAYTWDSGTAVRRDFDRGVFFWSEKTGAHFICWSHYLYSSLRFNYVYPTTDSAWLEGWQPGSVRGPEKASFTDFRDVRNNTLHTIVGSPGGVWTISGNMRTKWVEMGAGRFGVPVSDAYSEYGGKIQTFWFRGLTRGKIDYAHTGDRSLAAITYHKDTGVHVIIDANNHAYGSYHPWTRNGRASAYGAAWGFPTTDEYFVTENGEGRRDPVVHFKNPNQGGARMAHVSLNFANGPTGAITVTGALYNEWTRLGIPFVGMPTTDIIEKEHVRFQYFQPFRNGVFDENRLAIIQQDKATGHVSVSFWIKTVEGGYARDNRSSTSGALTIEEETLSSDVNILADLDAFSKPPITDGDIAEETTTFFDAWSQRLTAGLESSIGLFSQGWEGVTLNPDTAIEDGQWFTDFAATTGETTEPVWNDTLEPEPETPAEETFEEPTAEEALDAVFAEEYATAEEDAAILETELVEES